MDATPSDAVHRLRCSRARNFASAGAATAAALEIGRCPEAVGKTILAIVPSFSERYLSAVLFEGI